MARGMLQNASQLKRRLTPDASGVLSRFDPEQKVQLAMNTGAVVVVGVGVILAIAFAPLGL